MKTSYKVYLTTVATVFFVLVLFHMIPLVVVDPINISPLELTENEFFVREMRFQSAGIINKYEFDSAIVGSSMTENFSGEEASDKLPGEFKNLSMSGSLLGERKILLDYFLSSKYVNTIILSIDGVTDVQRNKGIPVQSWSYLYNDKRLDDLTLYTNRKYHPYINCHSKFKNSLIEYVFGRCPDKKIRGSLEVLTEWASNPGDNSRFGGIEKWIEYGDHYQVSRSIHNLTKAGKVVDSGKRSAKPHPGDLYDKDVFSANILPLIKNYPNTHFILFFPPYSIYRYAIDAQTRPEVFSSYKALVKHVVLETEQFNNAEIYWFNDQDFTKDIANYKDLAHYNQIYNSLFLDYFSEQRSLINVSNHGPLLEALEQDAVNIDLPGFAKQFSGADKSKL